MSRLPNLDESGRTSARHREPHRGSPRRRAPLRTTSTAGAARPVSFHDGFSEVADAASECITCFTPSVLE